MRKARALTENQLVRLEKQLLKDQDSLIFNDVYDEEFNLKDEERSDEIDQANASVSNAQRLRFRNRETFYKKKIGQALKRFEEKRFGMCEECEEPIGYKRLSARPTADLCILCKEESEREEDASIFGSQSKSFGKKLDSAAAQA